MDFAVRKCRFYVTILDFILYIFDTDEREYCAIEFQKRVFLSVFFLNVHFSSLTIAKKKMSCQLLLITNWFIWFPHLILAIYFSGLNVFKKQKLTWPSLRESLSLLKIDGSRKEKSNKSWFMVKHKMKVNLQFGNKPRCPWCNGYPSRKWIQWHEFKSWTRLIAFHIELIPLGKVWIQLFSLQLWVNSRTD